MSHTVVSSKSRVMFQTLTQSVLESREFGDLGNLGCSPVYYLQRHTFLHRYLKHTRRYSGPQGHHRTGMSRAALSQLMWKIEGLSGKFKRTPGLFGEKFKRTSGLFGKNPNVHQDYLGKKSNVHQDCFGKNPNVHQGCLDRIQTYIKV